MVGVVGNDCRNHAVPGWYKGTMGYHIDGGRIFDPENYLLSGVECKSKIIIRPGMKYSKYGQQVTFLYILV